MWAGCRLLTGPNTLPVFSAKIDETPVAREAGDVKEKQGLIEAVLLDVVLQTSVEETQVDNVYFFVVRRKERKQHMGVGVFKHHQSLTILDTGADHR